MKVKNIKSFIDFYKSMNVSTCISPLPRKSGEKAYYLNRNDQNLNNSLNNAKDSDLSLEKLKEEIKNCDCNLKDIATNFVFSDGIKNSDIMVIGEAPGAEEDKQGKPFVGQAGQLLDKMFRFIDLDRQKNFYLTNIIFWRPPGNRTPNKQEISICLPYVKKHIKLIKPKFLILLGNIAAQSLLETKEGINILRTKINYFEDKNLNLKIPVKAVFHPAYLLRNPIEKKKMWYDLLEIYEFISTKKIIE